MPELRIAADLTLPDSAATQTFAVIAQRGVGKTYTAKVVAEEMLKVGSHVAVIDPLDVWWGLRSSDDGEHAGLPIVVFGGAHGDLPLHAENAATIADMVVEQHLSAVLSIGHLRKKEQRQFVGTFCERLYHRKGEPALRYPTHVFIDEADIFIPQKLAAGAETSREAVDDMVRRGRVRGLGVTLITQRMAVVDKDVLTQASVLVVLRVVASQDRAAVEDWIKANAELEDRQAFVESLSGLPVGTAWIWSPGWLDLFKKVKIRRLETFDSSATPKVGETPLQPTALADVDLERLRALLSETIQKAEQEDPRALRRRIEELEAQLAKGARVDVREVEKVIEVRVPVFQAEDLQAFRDGIQEVLKVAARLTEVGETFEENVQAAIQAVEQPPKSGTPPPPSAPPSSVVGRQSSVVSRRSSVVEAQEQTALTDGAQGLLNVLVDRHPLALTHNQWAGLAERGNKSSSLYTHKRELQQAGLVEARNGLYALTRQAQNLYQHRLATNRNEPLVEVWRRVLDGGPRKMFDVLVAVSGAWVERDELARKSGFSPTSSSVGVHLKVLRDNDLAETQGKRVRLKPGIL
jgi:hypothetical protein